MDRLDEVPWSVRTERLLLRRLRASWHVMEKLGMRREMHTKKDALLHSGEWVDGLMYAILAEEWRERM